MATDPLIVANMVQLVLQTGEQRIVPCTPPPGYTLALYFECINTLNKQAHIYGVLYLATPEALAALLKTNAHV